MKHRLLTTIAAVVLVGCGESEQQHSQDDDNSHTEGVKAATQAWADAFNSRVLDKILVHYSEEAVFWEPFPQPSATNHLKCAIIS